MSLNRRDFLRSGIALPAIPTVVAGSSSGSVQLEPSTQQKTKTNFSFDNFDTCEQLTGSVGEIYGSCWLDKNIVTVGKFPAQIFHKSFPNIFTAEWLSNHLKYHWSGNYKDSKKTVYFDVNFPQEVNWEFSEKNRFASVKFLLNKGNDLYAYICMENKEPLRVSLESYCFYSNSIELCPIENADVHRIVDTVEYFMTPHTARVCVYNARNSHICSMVAFHELTHVEITHSLANHVRFKTDLF